MLRAAEIKVVLKKDLKNFSWRLQWWELLVCLIRLEQGENLEENQRNLLQITERFFQAIIGSSSEFPPQLRSVCHCLYQVGPPPPSIHHGPSPSCSPSLSALTCVRHLHISSSCLSTVRSPDAARLTALYITHISAQLYIPFQLHTFCWNNTSRPFNIFMFEKFILCQGRKSLKHHGALNLSLILKRDLIFLAFAIMTVNF